MKTIDKSPEVLARLQSFETFRGLPPEPLRWLSGGYRSRAICFSKAPKKV